MAVTEICAKAEVVMFKILQGGGSQCAIAILLAAMAVAAPHAVRAQTVAETNASLDELFGEHAPYHAFFDALKKAVAADDRNAVAGMVSYPFGTSIHGKDATIRDAAHFVKNYHEIITPKVKKAIADQTYATIFANWQGVMFGDGELWFSGVGDPSEIKIIGINN